MHQDFIVNTFSLLVDHFSKLVSDKEADDGITAGILGSFQPLFNLPLTDSVILLAGVFTVKICVF